MINEAITLLDLTLTLGVIIIGGTTFYWKNYNALKADISENVKDVAILKEKVDGHQHSLEHIGQDISDMKTDLHHISRCLGELKAGLRAQGIVNGNHKK